MIEAKFWQVPGRWHLSLQGHAGYAKEGPDLVCGAVSTLIAALEQQLEEGIGGPVARLSIQPPPGADIRAAAQSGKEELVGGWFSLVCGALAALAQLYPENIRFTEQRGDGLAGPGKEQTS